MRDRHLAEDATQQTFLDIWRNLQRLRDPAKFGGWSYRLLVHACYAEAKRKPKWVPENEIGTTDEPSTGDASAEVAARDQLERGFEHLSLDHRTVIVLHHLMDMTMEQVAQTLDIPRGTVYSRLSRAMEALRDAMEADGASSAPSPEPQEAVR